MIVSSLKPCLTVFQLYHSGQCSYPCFPGGLLTITQLNILSKPLAAFPHNHCQTRDSGEREMNPVVMTIISPLKEYCRSHGSNQRLSVLKSAALSTRLGYISKDKSQ